MGISLIQTDEGGPFGKGTYMTFGRFFCTILEYPGLIQPMMRLEVILVDVVGV